MTNKSPGRQLGTKSLVALVISSMVGSGVFTTSGFSLAGLGSPWLVLAAWVVGAAVALCGAVAYGELAHRVRESGGEYVFLGRRLHPAAGYVAGWVSMLAGFTGAGAFAAAAFDQYAWPGTERPAWLPVGTLGAALIVVTTMANWLGISSGARLQNLIVAAKLTLLVAFAGVAVFHPDRWAGFAPLPAMESVDWLAFGTAITWISLSYCGFNAAVYVAEEAEPGAVPRSLWIGTLLVSGLYLLLNAIFVFGPPADAITGQPNVATIAAEAVAGPIVANLLRVAICLALASSVSASLMAGPRVGEKMATDGYLPRAFASQLATPRRAILAQGGAMLLVLQTTQLQQLLSYLSVTLAITASMAVGTLLIPHSVDNRRGERPRHLTLVCAAVFVVATLAAAAAAAVRNPAEAVATALTLAVGSAAYLLSRRSQLPIAK